MPQYRVFASSPALLLCVPTLGPLLPAACSLAAAPLHLHRTTCCLQPWVLLPATLAAAAVSTVRALSPLQPATCNLATLQCATCCLQPRIVLPAAFQLPLCMLRAPTLNPLQPETCNLQPCTLQPCNVQPTAALDPAKINKTRRKYQSTTEDRGREH